MSFFFFFPISLAFPKLGVLFFLEYVVVVVVDEGGTDRVTTLVWRKKMGATLFGNSLFIFVSPWGFPSNHPPFLFPSTPFTKKRLNAINTPSKAKTTTTPSITTYRTKKTKRQRETPLTCTRRPRSPRKRHPLLQTHLQSLPHRKLPRLPSNDLLLVAAGRRHPAPLPRPSGRLAAQITRQHEFRGRGVAGTAVGRSGGDREGWAALGGSACNLRGGADRVGEFACGACGRRCACCDN